MTDWSARSIQRDQAQQAEWDAPVHGSFWVAMALVLLVSVVGIGGRR